MKGKRERERENGDEEDVERKKNKESAGGMKTQNGSIVINGTQD